MISDTGKAWNSLLIANCSMLFLPFKIFSSHKSHIRERYDTKQISRCLLAVSSLLSCYFLTISPAASVQAEDHAEDASCAGIDLLPGELSCSVCIEDLSGIAAAHLDIISCADLGGLNAEAGGTVRGHD